MHLDCSITDFTALKTDEFERDNLLFWFSTATEEEIKRALEEHKETATRLMGKYKIQIDLIRMIKGMDLIKN